MRKVERTSASQQEMPGPEGRLGKGNDVHLRVEKTRRLPVQRKRSHPLAQRKLQHLRVQKSLPRRPVLPKQKTGLWTHAEKRRGSQPCNLVQSQNVRLEKLRRKRQIWRNQTWTGSQSDGRLQMRMPAPWTLESQAWMTSRYWYRSHQEDIDLNMTQPRSETGKRKDSDIQRDREMSRKDVRLFRNGCVENRWRGRWRRSPKAVRSSLQGSARKKSLSLQTCLPFRWQLLQ